MPIIEIIFFIKYICLKRMKSIKCTRELERKVNSQINFDLLSRLCCSGATSCKLKRNSNTYGYS